MIGLECISGTKSQGAAEGRDSMMASLRASDLYRGYRRAFEYTVGLPLDLNRPDTFHFPLAGSRHQSRFCLLMAARNRTCAACLQLQQRLHDEAVHGPATIECVAGLSESAVPVRVGVALVGYLRTGQVFLESPTRRRLRETLSRLGVEKSSIEASKLADAYFQTRVLSKAKYQAALSLLRIFSEHLGTLVNRLMIERLNAELPIIAKARTFIEQHYSENMRLEDVAHAANVSAFYFCKLFSRVNGMTYTQYLARVRTEAAKQKLLNPNTRVCEAAYATGFQSLSQFNRVFRRVAGETPTAFRDRAHVDVCFQRRT